MSSINEKIFEKIVKEAAKNTTKVVDVAVNGFDIFVKYSSKSGKIIQQSHLVFDKTGKFIAGYGNTTANVPKFLVDKIVEIIKHV